MHRNKTAKRAHNTSLTKSSHCQGLVASLEVPASSQEPKKVQCVSKKMILCEKMAKIRNPENALFLKKPSTTFSKNSFKFQI